MWRIGLLSTGPISNTQPLFNVFQEQLRELGYVDGQNVSIESRAADGNNERLPGLAAELVKLKVDVLLTTGTPAAVAAKRATSVIPIVTAVVADPVGAGLVTNLARPGGNLTGIADLDDELTGKRLGLLKEAVPRLSRVAIIWKRGNPAHKTALKEAEVVARTMDLQFQTLACFIHERARRWHSRRQRRHSAAFQRAEIISGRGFGENGVAALLGAPARR